jgi:signal transduction histidine kinase/ligand-binding sensor domain-containing protein/DNA-binding response OmpR family regulator
MRTTHSPGTITTVSLCLVVGSLISVLCGPRPSLGQTGDRERTDLFGPGVELVFEHITVDDGLPENSVRAILQDTPGFLWFGTMNGLVRYDGQQLKVFSPSQTDTTSFGGRTVLALHEDDAGTIWIGTFVRGLWKYDPEVGTFEMVDLGRSGGGRPEADRVNSITEDGRGRIWVGMQYGLVSIDIASGNVVWHDELTAELGHDSQAIAITSVMADTSGRIWCGTDNNGVVVYTLETGKVRWLQHNPDRAQSLPSSVAYDIAQTADGKIWIATTAGLALWQEATGEFIVHRPARDSGDPGLNVMVRIEVDDQGMLWLGAAAGLYVFDPETLQFRLFAHDRNRQASPVDGPILSLMFDRSGILWAGSWHAGLNRVNPAGGGFHVQSFGTEFGKSGSLTVETVFEDSKGAFWVGTSDVFRDRGQGSLYRRSSPGAPFEAIPAAGKGRELLSLRSLWEDSSGTIWVGTYQGLWKIEADRVIPVDTGNDPNSAILAESHIQSLVGDRAGKIWMGSFGNGLFRWDPVSGELDHFRHNLLDPHSISSDDLTAVHEDRSGRIWIGTDARGLNLFRSDESGFQRFFAPEQGLETVSDILESPRGDLWLASFSGLVRFDPSTGATEIISRKDGLPNDQTAAILADDQGYYWVSTGFGLARVDPVSHLVRAFDTVDGLPDNEIKTAHIRSRDGALHFGGRTGLVSFDPARFVDSSFQPPVVITDIALSDTFLVAGLGSPLMRLPHRTEKLVLEHDQNDLSLSFAALDYGRPDQTMYRYKLEGLDENWRTPVAPRRASYTNLKPASYVFMVQGTNRDGVWSQHEARLEIRILPPWWRTWWAYSIWVLAFGLLALGVFRQMILRERLRAKIEMQRNDAAQMQELERLKAKFLTNITHEFRTPLTMIKAPLLRLQAELEDRTDDRITTMIRNTDRLEHLISQLLDLSRLEAGRLPLHWQREECFTFLRGFVQGFEALATQKALSLEMSIPTESELVWFDTDVLEKVIGNLMSNAVKYTPEGGRIEFRIVLAAEIFDAPVPKLGRRKAAQTTAAARQLVISIENSDSYIPPEKRRRVFDRFYQIAATDGSGVGLALVKELVDWLGGSIVLDSSLESGTCFTVTIPVFLQNPEVEPGATALPVGKPFEAVAEADFETEDDDNQGAAFDEPRILVVEDNTDLREFLAADFSPQYTILTAEDGQTGLEIAIEKIPDLILSDVMMPVMDGFEMCRNLKEDERTSHIPIILLTARSDAESRHEGLRLGADDYVAKPFDVQDLGLRVQNLIEQRRKLAEIYERKIAVLSPEAMAVSSADERFVVQLRAAIDANLDDPDFKINSLCTEVGMSRSQLHRKLKAVIGKSTSDFVRSHRIRRAATLFDGGYGNVTEVAYAVGFKNLSYFSKSFKETYGVQPSEYLRKNDQ